MYENEVCMRGSELKREWELDKFKFKFKQSTCITEITENRLRTPYGKQNYPLTHELFFSLHSNETSGMLDSALIEPTIFKN